MEEVGQRNTIRYKTKPLILTLNNDCLLAIIEFLEFSDAMNLAEVCLRLRYLVDLVYQSRSTTFFITSMTIDERNVYMKRLFSHIGQHLTSLSIDCGRKKFQTSRSNTNKSLETSKQLMAFDYLDKVETLTLYDCSDDDLPLDTFCLRFRNLKNLNFCGSYPANRYKVMQTLFLNNPIESIVMSRVSFRCIEFLQLIPTLSGLRLGSAFCQIDLNRSSPPYFKNLTKLTLTYTNRNLNFFLHLLQNKEILKELELHCQVDDGTFEELQYFSNLQVLIVISHQRTLCSNVLKKEVNLPREIKQLRLGISALSCDDYIHIINQLQHLEMVDLFNCTLPPKSSIRIASYWSVSINQLMDPKQTLSIVFPSWVQHNLDASQESDRLKIVENDRHANPLNICIKYPGVVE